MKNRVLAAAVLLFMAFADTGRGDTGVVVREEGTALWVSNGVVAAELSRGDGPATITFKAIDAEGQWRDVCRTFVPDFATNPLGNRFFDTTVTPHRYLVSQCVAQPEVFRQSPDEVVVSLTGTHRGAMIEQTVSLARADAFFRVETTLDLPEPVLDYAMWSLEFASEGKPTFVHSPTVKMDDRRSGPGRDQVIGDPAFHSPAIVLEAGGLYAALVPNLDTINEAGIVSPDARRTQRVPRNKFSVPIEDDKYTMPTALDLNIASGLGPRAVMSFGVMDFVVGHHVRYQRVNDGSMVRRLNARRVRFGCDVLCGATEPPGRAFQTVSQHLWRRFGTRQFAQPHLAMPFEQYVRTIYDVVSVPMDATIQPPVPGHENHGVFIDFDREGEKVGGMVTPLGVLGFGDSLWNSVFWNNVRDARGMHHWGEKLGDEQMAQRGQRIINLALQAPQNEAGFFPTIYAAASGRWVLSGIGPAPTLGSIFAREHVVYDVPGMSKTVAYLLEYHQQCRADPRIVEYARRYANGLAACINPDGSLPSYFTAEMAPLEPLRVSAQPAASMWCLAELYNVTRDAQYLRAAERLAEVLRTDVLPGQKWVDLEPYYSCGRNPLTYREDQEQGLPVRGNLSTFWAAKGFAALFRATGKREYLEDGASVVDYGSFSQACWSPHSVYTANPFGGITADNVDTANYLDARQCEWVEPMIWYGQALGRQDLLERGVAAARASVVLINHPLHKANGIYRHPNVYGFGLGPENINHEGHNQSTMRTHPGWGECSAIFTALADADRMLGGASIDLARRMGVGVDGVHITAVRDLDGHVVIEIVDQLARLTEPWREPRPVTLRLDNRGNTLPVLALVNGSAPQAVPAGESVELSLTLHPSGEVRLDE